MSDNDTTPPAAESPAPAPITFSVQVDAEFGTAWGRRRTPALSGINVRESIATDPRLLFLEAVDANGKRFGDSGFQMMPAEMDHIAVEWLARRYPQLAETLRQAVPASSADPVIDTE